MIESRNPLHGSISFLQRDSKTARRGLLRLFSNQSVAKEISQDDVDRARLLRNGTLAFLGAILVAGVSAAPFSSNDLPFGIPVPYDPSSFIINTLTVVLLIISLFLFAGMCLAPLGRLGGRLVNKFSVLFHLITLMTFYVSWVGVMVSFQGNELFRQIILIEGVMILICLSVRFLYSFFIHCLHSFGISSPISE